MKNKIEKYIRILFVLIMIISQTGLLPVYAEANNKDNVKGLTVSISKNEVNIGDEVAVTVQGSKKMIKDVEIETDSSLKKIRNEKSSDTSQRTIYRTEKSGQFNIKAKSASIESNNVMLTVLKKEKSDTTQKKLRDADHKYTVNLTAPSDVEFASENGYNGYSFVVTVNTQATPSDPTKGIELTFTPPAGYSVDTIPTGADSPVKSYKINANGSVTIVMNDMTKGIEDFNISVKPITDGNQSNSIKDRYDDEKLEGSIVGISDDSGNKPSDSTETTLHGDINYQAQKSAEVMPSSGNRRVTYTFDARKKSSIINQLAFNELTFTDDIPAGAIIESQEDAKGKWTITGDKVSGWHAVWIYKGLINNANYLSSVIGNVPKLVVYYPKDKFPTGSKPPLNVVDLSEKDIVDKDWKGDSSQVQGPEFSDGVDTAAGISKNISVESWNSGAVYGNYTVKSSFLTPPTGEKAKQLTMTDERDDLNNESFWSHYLVKSVKIEFNKSIVTSRSNYRLEYKTTSNGWRTADSGKATSDMVTVGFQVIGSSGYAEQDRHTKTINLEQNESLSGWRVIILDDTGQGIGESSEVKATVLGVPSFANLYNKSTSDTTNKLKNTASNEIVLADGTKMKKVTSSAAATVNKNLYMVTTVKAPSSLEVGKNNNYEVTAGNATPEEDIEDGIMRIVLPAGVTYDDSVGASAVSLKTDTPYNFNVPQVGNGVNVSTEMIPSGSTYKYSRQVVIFKFKDKLLSMRNAGDPSSRSGEYQGYKYNVPVKVSQVAYSAYQNSAQRAPVESWLNTTASKYDDYTIAGTSNAKDSYNFDAVRGSIPWAQGNSQIISKGGLLLSKLVEGTKGSGFSDEADTTYDSAATWKLNIQNTLATTAKNPVIFDDIAKINGDSTFVTTLADEIKVPVNATVEYSKNATSATNGTWSKNWKGAKSFRVTFSDMEKNDSYEVTIPVRVPKSADNEDKTLNTASGTANINGQDLSYVSNGATLNIKVPLGNVVLTKTDSKTNIKLAGAKFELQSEAGKKISGDWETDVKGQISIPDLKSGKYQLVEVSAPLGYELDQTPVKFEIIKGETKTVSVSMDNKLMQGSVILTKIDTKTKEKLTGAVFELQDKDGRSLQSGLTTDSSGQLLVKNLDPGEYQLIETKAPTGYILDQTPLKFEVVVGQTTPLLLSMTNKLMLGGVVLEKQDVKTKEKLAGAVFELQDKTGKILQSGLITDTSGKIAVKDLEPGNYQFVETKSPTGYEQDKTPVKFEIKKGQTQAVEVTMTNDLTKGGVILTKTDDKSGLGLQGAIFELQDKSGKILQSGLTTDTSGKIAVKDLEPGNYQFVETKSPTGYKLDKTPVKFEVKKGQTQAVEVSMTNTLTKGGVILTKTDDKSGQVLQGAVFELQDKDGNVLQNGLITDAAGKIAIKDLEPGNYQFIETKAPTGYEQDKTPVKFEITKSQTVVKQVKKDNTQSKGGITLTKEDDKTASALAGAEFRLEDSKGKILKSNLVTDTSGKLFIGDLKLGKYQLIETKAPIGYILDKAPVKFEIKNHQDNVQITMTNHADKGGVILNKVDAETGKKLATAEFELQDEKGNILHKRLITDANGQLSVADLSVGKYQFVETKAPNGYEIDKTPRTFEIKTGQTQVFHVQVANMLNKNGVDLTKIDEKNGESLIGAEFELQNQSGKVIKSGLVTDLNGKISVKSLKAGKYQFIETKAPKGYKLDATPVKFRVTAEKDTAVNVKKTNKLLEGSVLLMKIDDKTGKTLSGSEFRLENEKGKVIKANLTTDTKGQILISKLEAGKYQFVETKAPRGYELDKTPSKFTMKKAGNQLVKVYKTNHKETSVVPEVVPTKPNRETAEKHYHVTVVKEKNKKLPQTDEVKNNNLFVLGLLLIGVSGILLYKKRN